MLNEVGSMENLHNIDLAPNKDVDSSGVFLSATHRKMIAGATATVILALQAACAVPGATLATATEDFNENNGRATEQVDGNTGVNMPSQSATPSATEAEPTPTATALPEWYPSEDEIPSEERIAELMQYVQVKEGFYVPTKAEVQGQELGLVFIVDEQNGVVYGTPENHTSEDLEGSGETTLKTYLFSRRDYPNELPNSSYLSYEFLLYWGYHKGYDIKFLDVDYAEEVFSPLVGPNIVPLQEDFNRVMNILNLVDGVGWVFLRGQPPAEVHLVFPEVEIDENLEEIIRNNSKGVAGGKWSYGNVYVLPDSIEDENLAKDYVVEVRGLNSADSIIVHR